MALEAGMGLVISQYIWWRVYYCFTVGYIRLYLSGRLSSHIADDLFPSIPMLCTIDLMAYNTTSSAIMPWVLNLARNWGWNYQWVKVQFDCYAEEENARRSKGIGCNAKVDETIRWIVIFIYNKTEWWWFRGIRHLSLRRATNFSVQKKEGNGRRRRWK